MSEVTIKPGDRVRHTPNDPRNSIVEGILVEEIKNTSGERGWHILAPLPGDPTRVVRVWQTGGELTLCEAAPEPVVTPAEAPAPSGGLSLAEAKAHLEERAKEGVFGMTWEELERRQGGGKITR